MVILRYVNAFDWSSQIVFFVCVPCPSVNRITQKMLTNCYEIFGRIGFGARNKHQWIRFRGWSGSAAQTGPQRFPGDACCSVANSTSRFIEIICCVYNEFIGNVGLLVFRPNCHMMPFFWFYAYCHFRVLCTPWVKNVSLHSFVNSANVRFTKFFHCRIPVSYTHLTLPTILRV